MMTFFRLMRVLRQWFPIKGRPFHIHPAFIIYRRFFYCKHNKHATYPEGHFCIFCSKQLVPFPEWEVRKIGYEPVVISALNERHAVECAIKLIYGLNVDDALYHTFQVQQIKLRAFKDAVPVTVDEDMIICAKVEMKAEKGKRNI